MHRTRASAGFTLTEMSVTLGVVALLVSIAAPVLSSVRLAASQTKSLANLRGIGQSTGLYLNTYAGDYPFGTSGWIFPPWTANPYGIAFDIWSIRLHWPSLYHTVAPWPEHAEAWISPGADRSELSLVMGGFSGAPSGYSTAFTPSYRYSTSFVASGRLWSGNAPPDPALVRAVRASAVRHPSAKVLMLDADRGYLADPQEDDPRPLLLADGSADARLDRDATKPVANPFLLESDARRYHDTRDGVLGRDFR